MFGWRTSIFTPHDDHDCQPITGDSHFERVKSIQVMIKCVGCKLRL